MDYIKMLDSHSVNSKIAKKTPSHGGIYLQLHHIISHTSVQ